MQGVKDSSGLYRVERRARHAERPGFPDQRVQILAHEQVPWQLPHQHRTPSYVCSPGELRIFLPRAEGRDVRLAARCETYPYGRFRPAAPRHQSRGIARRRSSWLSGHIGEYDYVR